MPIQTRSIDLISLTAFILVLVFVTRQTAISFGHLENHWGAFILAFGNKFGIIGVE